MALISRGSEHFTMFNAFIITQPYVVQQCHYPHFTDKALRHIKIAVVQVAEEVCGKKGPEARFPKSWASSILIVNLFPSG